MKDRIQIDGEWYVKEDQNQSKVAEPLNIDLVPSHTIIAEDDKYCFELDVLMQHQDCIFIEVINKSTKEKDVWDHVPFLKNLERNGSESVSRLVSEGYPYPYIELAQSMLRQAIIFGWLDWNKKEK